VQGCSMNMFIVTSNPPAASFFKLWEQTCLLYGVGTQRIIIWTKAGYQTWKLGVRREAHRHVDKERSSLFNNGVEISYPSPCIYIEHHLLNASAAICPVVCSFLQSSLLPPLASPWEQAPPPCAFAFHLSGACRDLPETPSALSLRSTDKSPVHRTPFAPYTASCNIESLRNYFLPWSSQIILPRNWYFTTKKEAAYTFERLVTTNIESQPKLFNIYWQCVFWRCFIS